MSMMEEGEFEHFPSDADFLISEQRRTQARAITSLNDSPDDAARAQQLAEATGARPEVIFPNLKEFETQHKADLTSRLLNSNAYLRGYLESNPIADKVSNDDYGQLDIVSGSMEKLPGYRKIAYNIANTIEQTVGLTAEGLGYLLGIEGTTGAAKRMKEKTLTDISTGPEQKKEFEESEKTIPGMLTSGITGIGTSAVLGAGSLPGMAIQMGLQGGAEARNRVRALGGDEQTQANAYTAGFAINSILGIAPLHLLTRPAQATGPGVVNWSLAKLQDAAMTGGIFAGFGELQHAFNEYAAKLLYDPKAEYHPDFNRVVSSFLLGGFLGATFNRVAPYVEAGQEIPPGAHPIVDHAKGKQAEIDIDNLDAALKEASKSATRERSPELFKLFMQQHTDAKIGVSAEAIVKMYGEKEPIIDDGKLGWVQDIKEQLAVARETGGDVEIPLADWLAHVDPTVAKELHDDIRVRPKGLTITESTALQGMPMVEAYHGSPHEFDAFSMEKIGSGEGAQSYGHGLYFAEQPAVSESYKTAGRRGTDYEIRGRKVSALAINDFGNAATPEGAAAFALMSAGNKSDVAIRYLERHERANRKRSGRVDETILEAIDIIEKGEFKLPSSGNLYRVRIHAEKDQFLDWDRLESEQPQAVRDFMIKHEFPSKEQPKVGDPYWDNMFKDVDLGPMHGENIYKGLVSRLGSRENVSKAMAEAGIPGIRYLDQGSRAVQDSLASLKEELAAAQKSLVDIENWPKDAGYRTLKVELEQHVRLLQAEIKTKENPTYNYVIFDEKLIEIVDRNGEAIQAVRQQAGLEPLARRVWSEEQLEGAAEALEGKIEEHAPGLKVIVPEGELTPQEVKAVTAANEVLDRILPKPDDPLGVAEAVTKVPARMITQDGKGGIQGFFQQYSDRIPTIMYLMDPKQAVHTVRHEAIHFLRHEGFFTKAEWDTLRHAALKEGWIEHYDIAKRYEGQDIGRMLEEAVAERYADWAEGNKHASEPVNKIMGRLKDFAIKMIETVKAALPHNVTVEELFKKIESGEIARREGTKPLDKKAFRSAQEAEKPKRLLPAIRTEDGEVHVGQITHEDVPLPRGPQGTDTSGWVTPDGKFLSRQEALAWIDKNQPEIAKQLEGETHLDANEYSYRMDGLEQKMAPEAEAAQRDLFAKANAIGMTIPQYERYMRLIKKRGEEDARKQMERAEAFERKQQTKEWKADEARIRDEITNDIQFRPDIAVAAFFTEGRLYDTIKNQRPKLDASMIDPELAKRLPKELLLKRGGINPDDIAPLFGYQTGKEMVSKLVEMNEARGEMKFGEFVKGIIDDEVAQRMLREHGMLEENILKAAEEHVVGDTQMDILHEEFIGLGMKSKNLDSPFTKEQIKAWATEKFDKLPLGTVKVDKFLSEAGKAGRDAEMKLLLGKVEEAFQHKTRQYVSMLLASEAKRLEKEQDKFDKTAKRFAAREVKGIDQSYTDYVQALLSLAGLRVRRTDKEIAESIEAFGTGSLKDFVDAKYNDGWDLAVSDNVQQSRVKPIEQMSVGEFREFKEAIDSLVHVGREEKKIIVGNERLDFETHKGEIISTVEQLPVRELGTKWRYMFDATLVKMEEIVRDLDGRMQAGPLFKAMILPLVHAKRVENDMLVKLSKDLQGIKGFGKEWKKSLSETIPNDFLIDPRSKAPYDLSRENMINIMLNFGNRSNIQKFTEGYGTKKGALQLEARLWQLFDQYATKEDWQFVQRVWDVFEGLRGESDAMYRRISGVPPKWVNVEGINTAQGQFKGGYFPILFDRDRSRIDVIEDKSASSGGTFGSNYIRAMTGASYTKARTGYVDYVSFEGSLEQVAGRMQQMIHDISHREAIMSVGKIIYDTEIRAAMRKHYGPEYTSQMHPWLRDIANHFNSSEQSIAVWNSLARRLRMNLITHALGFNLKVIGSPNLGMFNPKQATQFYADYAANRDLVMSKSDEIPHTLRNMDRDFREKLESLTQKNKWDETKKAAFEASMWPALKLEQQARMIGFWTRYNRGLKKGLTEAEAIAEADNQVRSFHGAAGTMDLPAIMRHPNELMKTATIFYGFFNTMYNWQRRIPGDIRAGEAKTAIKNLYGAVLIPAAFGAVLFNQQKQDDPWWKIIGKALLMQPLSTVPVIREVSSLALEGFPPRTPAESLMNAVMSAYSDVKKFREGRRVEKPISHAANVIGLSTGLPLGQIGRTTQFGTDVYRGLQQPKNIQEWIRGVISGEAKLKR